MIGTGPGIFTTFIRNHFANSLEKLVTIETNAAVLKVAQDHFGFDTDEDPIFDLVNGDTYEFVMKHPEEKFDLIFLDQGNYESGMTPAAKLHEPEFLNKLSKLSVAD